MSEQLSRLVIERAGSRCEYCRIHIENTYFGGEIDHIRSLKHGGSTEIDNLALACMPCNRNKGSDLGSISERSGNLVRFYDPRSDVWDEHFRIDEGAQIRPLTETGEVTARIFGFNDIERLAERRGLMEIGRYPHRI